MPRPATLPTLDWKAIFESGQTYKDWLANAENPDHRDKMNQYFEQTIVIPSEKQYVNHLPQRVNIVIIAEDWCGDVVRHVPALEKLVGDSDRVHTRYITREQHPDVFVRFLTNGGEAIPKMIFVAENWVETGNWGPMPNACREMISRGKASGEGGNARKITGALYKADQALREPVKEFLHLLEIASTTEIEVGDL